MKSTFLRYLRYRIEWYRNGFSCGCEAPYLQKLARSVPLICFVSHGFNTWFLTGFTLHIERNIISAVWSTLNNKSDNVAFMWASVTQCLASGRSVNNNNKVCAGNGLSLTFLWWVFYAFVCYLFIAFWYGFFQIAI